MNVFKHKLAFAGIALMLVIFGAAGCQSFDGSAQENLASVNIVNQPMASVQTAVTNVFTAHAFTGGLTATNEFTYKRPASRMDQIAYGSYMFDHPLTVKVVVTARQKNPTVIVLACNAWIVEADGDPTFQELHPVGMFGKGAYEDLLNEVRAQLK